MKHPLKALREEAGLTQASIAKEANVTSQVVLFLEQGLNRNAKVIGALSRLLGLSEVYLVAEHDKWLAEQLGPVAGRFQRAIESFDGGSHWQFRQQFGSLNDYCRTLKISPSAVALAESRHDKLPGVVGAAMLRAGVEEKWLSSLREKLHS